MAVRLRAECVSVSYRELLGRKVALRDLNLDAAPGRLTAIVGRNGSGKTTLVSVVMGFLRPDTGTCTIDGMDSAVYRRTNGIGYLPEVTTLPAGWTVRQILARAADLACRPGDRAEGFRKAVRRAGLETETLPRLACASSKGVQRRIAFAWALAGNPRLVVVDEPFSGLDPTSRIRMRRQLRSARDGGATVLMASHDLTEVEKLADHVFIMQRGTLLSTGHLRSDGRSLVTALEAKFFTPDPSRRAGRTPSE